MSFFEVEQATTRLNRSELAVPGSSPEFFEKAAKSEADVIFLDLEDAVAPDDKEKAREMIILTRQINEYLQTLHKEEEEENITITCWTCHKGKTEVEPKRPVEEE